MIISSWNRSSWRRIRVPSLRGCIRLLFLTVLALNQCRPTIFAGRTDRPLLGQQICLSVFPPLSLWPFGTWHSRQFWLICFFYLHYIHSTNVNSIVIEIPSREGSGVDLNNTILHQCFGSDQFVIGCVVDNVQNSCFSGGGFRGPVEVTFPESECSKFEVATPNSDASDPGLIIDKFGIGDGPSLFKGSFLFMNRHAATCQSSLMPGVPRDTHYHQIQKLNIYINQLKNIISAKKHHKNPSPSLLSAQLPPALSHPYSFPRLYIQMKQNQIILIINTYHYFMEQGSQVVIIYHPTQGNLNEIKRSIASAIGSEVTPEQVILKTRPHGITAYVELPAQIANSLTEKKTLMVDGKSLNVKNFYCDYQIFINKLPSSINAQDVQEYFGKFGHVKSVKIVNVTTNYEARHCYIKFEDSQQANKVLYHQKRHIIKNQQVRVHRTYTIGENDQTDKKIFLKIEPKVDKAEEMEKNLHNLFRKYGELRERIRIEQTSGNYNKAIITFTSHDKAEEAFKNEKQTTIGKHKLILRPFASDLALYVTGLRLDATDEQIREVFELHGKIIECNVNTKSGTKSATINYACQQNARHVLAEYPDIKEICALFNYNKPKITIHMSTRERNEFFDYNRKSKKTNNWQNLPMQQMQMQPFMQPMVTNQMMGQQMGQPMQQPMGHMQSMGQQFQQPMGQQMQPPMPFPMNDYHPGQMGMGMNKAPQMGQVSQMGKQV